MPTVDPVHRVATVFRRRFGHDPEAIASAPGRVNLIGEHVDHQGGVVLPLAIDRRTAVAVSPARDGRTTIVADDLDREATWPDSPPTSPLSDPDLAFANHVLGVVVPFAGSPSASPPLPPLSIAIASTLPVGGGLSSSAALEVATALATTAALGHPEPDVLALAERAQRAEHEWVGTPCGPMDMLVSAGGVADRVLRIDCRERRLSTLPAPPSTAYSLLLFDSGVRHRLADGGYASRLEALSRVSGALGRPLTRTTEDELASAPIEDADRRRARHVVTECRRVETTERALAAGDLDAVGDLMFEAHASLRDDFEVSIPEVDRLVEAAADHRDAGAIGARMTGGGFGGWVVVLARRHASDAVSTSIGTAFESRFGRLPAMIEVRASDGARIEATSERSVSYPRGRPSG